MCVWILRVGNQWRGPYCVFQRAFEVQSLNLVANSYYSSSIAFTIVYTKNLVIMKLTSPRNLLTPVSNLCMIGIRVFHLYGTPHIIEKLWGILFIYFSFFSSSSSSSSFARWIKCGAWDTQYSPLLMVMNPFKCLRSVAINAVTLQGPVWSVV